MVSAPIVQQPRQIEGRRSGEDITIMLHGVRRSGRVDVDILASLMRPPLRYCLSGNCSPKDSHEGGTLKIHGSGLGILTI